MELNACPVQRLQSCYTLAVSSSFFNDNISQLHNGTTKQRLKGCAVESLVFIFNVTIKFFCLLNIPILHLLDLNFHSVANKIFFLSLAKNTEKIICISNSIASSPKQYFIYLKNKSEIIGKIWL